MDFFNKLTSQTSELLRSMSPGARVASALLLVVVVVSLVFLLRFDATSANDYLLNGHVFSGRELAAAQGALAKAQLMNFVVEGSRIRVPRGQQAKYVAALVDGNAMPRFVGSWFEEIKDKTSPWESQRQLNVRTEVAVQNELTEVLRAMPGIEMASVLLGEATHQRGIGRETQPTASVGIMPVANAELDPEQIKSIKAFVADAIGGKAANVTVMDMNMTYSYSSEGDDGLAAASGDPHAQRQRWYEQWYTGKIKSQLGYIPGVKVETTVLLETDLQHQENSVKFDPQVVATKSQSSTVTERVTGRGPAGRPGAVPNAVVSNQQATVTQNQTTDTDKQQETESQESLASYDQTVISKAPLVPTRVTTSIVVPRSYYRKAWEGRNRTEDGKPPTTAPDQAALLAVEAEVKKDIQESIVNLLPPPPPGDAKYPLVTVTTFEDQTMAALPVPSTVEKASSWLARNWTTAGMLAVGLIGLLLLRTMVRGGPAAPPTPADLGATLKLLRPEEDEPVDESSEPAKAKRRFSQAGSNPRDELTEMVNENPEAAATILRSWIGEAG